MAASLPSSPGCGDPACTLCAWAQAASSAYAQGGYATPAWVPSAPPGWLAYAQGAGGYAGYAAQPPPAPSPGLPGFEDAGEFEPAAGVVTGVRRWGLPAPDLNVSPLAADRRWPRSLLSGQKAEWQPGLNEAVCLQGFDHPVPWEKCGCGHWAFWEPRNYALGGSYLPVLGVVEGSGRILHGEKGFRCQRAKIIALHLPDILSHLRARRFGWYDAFGNAYMQPPPELAPAERDWVDAWRAVISDRLEQVYPGVRLYERQETMLKLHPPDAPPEPEPESPSPCRHCGIRVAHAELAAHEGRCPFRLP